MHDEHPHPLLAQVPLTISPFLSLPTSVPLPYSYKTLPSTLPPSILSPQNTTSTSSADQNPQHNGQIQPPAYITSASGTSSTPDAILQSCLALQTHLQKLEDDAKRTLNAWEERRRQEDLAEKRRLAPGWLDSGVHILKPEESEGNHGMNDGRGERQEVQDLMDDDPQQREAEKRGEELDRVFGGLKV